VASELLYCKIEQTLFESLELSVEKLVSLKAACQLELDVSLKQLVEGFIKIGCQLKLVGQLEDKCGA
jgi:hypothetical protein